MTQPQAIFCCLTHTRNEVIESLTTPTRITYRTFEGAVLAYEGTCPALTHPALSRPPAVTISAAVRGSVHRLAGLLEARAVLTTRLRRDPGAGEGPPITLVHDEAAALFAHRSGAGPEIADLVQQLVQAGRRTSVRDVDGPAEGRSHA